MPWRKSDDDSRWRIALLKRGQQAVAVLKQDLERTNSDGNSPVLVGPWAAPKEYE